MAISRRTVIKAGLATSAAAALGCGAKPKSASRSPSPAKPVRFIHITDTHVDLGNQDSISQLERFAALVAKDYADIDFVLMGGDNFNNNVAPGEDASQLKALLSPIQAPIFAVRGNKESHHALDPRGYSLSDFQRDFGEGLSWTGRDWKLDAGSVTILGIDTTIDGQDNGLFAAKSLQFVESELTANPNQPHLLLSHHPYQNFWGGTEEPDLHKYVIGNADEVHRRLFPHDNLIATLAGHKHLDDVSTINNTTVISTVGFIVPQAGNQDDRRFRVITMQGTSLEQQLVSTA